MFFFILLLHYYGVCTSFPSTAGVHISNLPYPDARLIRLSHADG